MKDLPDSGQRQSFGSGMAIREADEAKPAMVGISPFAMKALGMLMTRANKKYGDYRNWEKGMPVTRCLDAILRHTTAYLEGDDTEDHMASVMWNAMCLIHFKAVGGTGASFEELDDRPQWRKKSDPA